MNGSRTVSVNHLHVGPNDRLIVMSDDIRLAELRESLAHELGLNVEQLVIIAGGRAMFTFSTAESH